MTITQTGRRLALVGLLAMIAALLPLTGASAISGTEALDLQADESDNVAISIANSQVLYTPIADENGDPATPDNPPTEALIGRADLFADNLASGALQGVALAGGRPLLLNDLDEDVNADVLAELDRLLGGTGTVHILGGVEAQGEGVAEALEAAGYTTNRFAGETRTETAIEIARANGSDTALLVRSTASGDDETQAFADALGAGALAASNGWSVLFTQTSTLTETTADFLAEDDAPDNIIIVGGTMAVSQETEDLVTEIVGEGNVSRVSGTNRFATAVALNGLRDQDALGDFAIAVDGQQDNAWADGFTMANLSGSGNYPLVLTNGDNLPTETADYLTAIYEGPGTTFANHFANAAIVCGSTVSDAACQAIADALGLTVVPFPPAPEEGPVGNTTVTTQPELVSAAIVGTVTPTQATTSNPAGTTVAFTFDEPVTSASAPAFRVYTNTNQQFLGTATVGFTSGTDTVNVRFDGVNSTAAASTLTLATVAQGAVLASDGQGNPEGDAPIGTASSTAVTAGTTSAPDLITVANVRAGTPNTQTAVDFTFDEAAFVRNVNGFELILTNGTVVPCVGSADTSAPSGGSVPGGSSTATLTLSCTNPGGSTTAIAAADVARGNALEGAVSDAFTGGNLNVLQSADVSNAGNTINPDIVEAIFQPDAATGIDRVIFVFDQPVATVSAASPNTGFVVYTATAATNAAGFVNTITNNRVAVDFPDNTLSTAVGVNILANTVTAAPNTTGGPNQRDEVGVQNDFATVVTPGGTSGPQLVSVALADSTDATGASTGFRATYTFDEDVDLSGNPVGTRFFLWQADGTRLVAQSCTNPTAEDLDHTVTCAFVAGAVTSSVVQSAVLGTVAFDAVREEGATTAGTASNPEGGEPTTGGNGTPTS